ncbi:MAG: carboxypeptidase regulatory-like domain-containing protein [Gemmatimonadales bacterium]
MLERTRLLATVAAAGLVWACGGGGDAGAGDGGAAPDEGGETAAPIVDPATAGAITGFVAFEGEAPAAERIDMAEEPECNDAYPGGGALTQHALVSSDGRLGNVFVYVKEGLDSGFPAPSQPVLLDQEHCRYHPHILGIQVDQPLLIRNSDPILHNINSQPSLNRGFNISQPQAGMETTRDFGMAEVMIPVKCDVHGWMNAYVGVVDNPYFAVSRGDGSFSLPNLPPGNYVVEAWHELFGAQTADVTVGEGATAEVSFTFSAGMARNAVVPLGDPLIIKHADDGSITAVRERSGD